MFTSLGMLDTSSHVMNATFKAKIQTDSEGVFIKVPKRMRINNISHGYGQLAPQVLENRLGLTSTRILRLPDVTGKIICVQGGFISEFKASV